MSPSRITNYLRQGKLEPLFDWYGSVKEKRRHRTCARRARRAHRIALKRVRSKQAPRNQQALRNQQAPRNQQALSNQQAGLNQTGAVTLQPVQVVFLLIHESVWKYDALYRLMENDPRFNPIIVVCPYTLFGDDILFEELHRTYNHFSARYTHVVSAWDEENECWTDIKESLKPDLVFFTNPHELTMPEYYIHHFPDTLTAYVQYSFHITHLNNLQYNQSFHNLVWKLFYETPFHARLAATHAANRGRNVVVTGYPGTDIFLDPTYQPKDPWKPAPAGTKRIIWAPHHTIFDNDSDLSYSTFLSYAEYFLQLAQAGLASESAACTETSAGTETAASQAGAAVTPNVQLAFKPHPVLKAKLYNHPDWGKERTDAYYEAWKTAPRGQLEEGDYTDLFLTSHAMAFDSASFMTEYLYTGKPSQFLVNDNRITERFNDFGKHVYELLYHAHRQTDIEDFLKTVVEAGHDTLQEARNTFLYETLIPPNNRTASENIYEYLNTLFI